MHPGIRQTKLNIHMNRADARNFHLHAHNIAVAKGWIPFDHTRNSTSIILPENELPDLEPIKLDPYSWLNLQSENRPARSVKTHDPVKIKLSTPAPQRRQYRRCTSRGGRSHSPHSPSS